MRTTRDMRGAAGLESVLALVVLAPLMGGLFVYGNYFWQAQRVDVYAPHVAQDSIVGQFTCAQLLDRVKTTAEGVLASTTSGLGAQSAGTVAARVVEIVPNQGVTVDISVSVPVTTPFPSILPNHGQLVSEVTQRLENVSLTTDTCL